MAMSNEEIVRFYKEAKYPLAEVKILAELNACDKGTIKNILREYNVLKEERQRSKEDFEKAIEEAIRKLEREGQRITIPAIMKEADVTLYRVNASKAYRDYHDKKMQLREKTKEIKKTSRESTNSPVNTPPAAEEKSKDDGKDGGDNHPSAQNDMVNECSNKQACPGCLNDYRSCGHDLADCMDFEDFGPDYLGGAERAAKILLIACAATVAAVGSAITIFIVKRAKRGK